MPKPTYTIGEAETITRNFESIASKLDPRNSDHLAKTKNYMVLHDQSLLRICHEGPKPVLITLTLRNSGETLSVSEKTTTRSHARVVRENLKHILESNKSSLNRAVKNLPFSKTPMELSVPPASPPPVRGKVSGADLTAGIKDLKVSGTPPFSGARISDPKLFSALEESFTRRKISAAEMTAFFETIDPRRVILEESFASRNKMSPGKMMAPFRQLESLAEAETITPDDSPVIPSGKQVSIVGEQIRRRAEELNLSIAQLERDIGVKPGAIAQTISGRVQNPRAEVVAKAAKRLGCSAEELMTPSTDPTPPSTPGSGGRTGRIIRRLFSPASLSLAAATTLLSLGAEAAAIRAGESNESAEDVGLAAEVFIATATGLRGGPWGAFIAGTTVLAVRGPDVYEKRVGDDPNPFTRMTVAAAHLPKDCVSLIFSPTAAAPQLKDHAGRLADATVDLSKQLANAAADHLEEIRRKGAAKREAMPEVTAELLFADPRAALRQKRLAAIVKSGLLSPEVISPSIARDPLDRVGASMLIGGVGVEPSSLTFSSNMSLPFGSNSVPTFRTTFGDVPLTIIASASALRNVAYFLPK